MATSKIFYGWIIVGTGIVITCIGMGAMLSLSIFLQPVSGSMGWSRAGISAAGMLNFLTMGAGAILWGALSDRFGTRSVVLAGGVLLGLGLVTASRAATLGQFQLCFGVIVGLAVGSLYAPVIATTTRWFTENRSLAVALVSLGLSLGSAVMGPLARGLITGYDWRTAMLVIGELAWIVIIPASLLMREPPRSQPAAGAAARAEIAPGPERTAAQALRTPQFAALALAHFCCCAAHSGPIFHMVANAIDHGVGAMAAATVFSVAGVGSLCGRVVCGIMADRIGAKRMLLTGLALQALAVSLYLVVSGARRLLRACPDVRLRLRRRHAALRDPRPRVLRRADHGHDVRRGRLRGHVGHVDRAPWPGGWLYDGYGSYFWLFLGSFGIGLGAVAIALTFRPPRPLPIAQPRPSLAV